MKIKKQQQINKLPKKKNISLVFAVVLIGVVVLVVVVFVVVVFVMVIFVVVVFFRGLTGIICEQPLSPGIFKR